MIELSAIILIPDASDGNRRLLKCLAAQTARDRLELVFVSTRKNMITLKDPDLQGFAAITHVAIDSLHSSAAARAAGIRRANAPVIVLTEDHSFPEPGWAEALIRAHKGSYAVVGPRALNANPSTTVSWVNFLIEYVEWYAAIESAPARHLPGHNSAYKKDVLLAYGNALDKWLEVESLMQWDLVAHGHKLLLEPAARIRHMNFSQILPSLLLRLYCGRQFAGQRRCPWGLIKRFLYIVGSPLIPLVRLYRTVRLLSVSAHSALFILRLLPLMLFFLSVDAAGELAGYILGSGSTAAKIVPMDFHRDQYMTNRDRKSLGYI